MDHLSAPEDFRQLPGADRLLAGTWPSWSTASKTGAQSSGVERSWCPRTTPRCWRCSITSRPGSSGGSRWARARPTRTARTGSALTARGRINLRNARFARDPRPFEEGCGCPACADFSRAFVRHLVNQHELLGLRLLTLHNLWFTVRLTAGARDAITRGTFEDFRAKALESLAAGPEEEPWHS